MPESWVFSLTPDAPLKRRPRPRRSFISGPTHLETQPHEERDSLHDPKWDAFVHRSSRIAVMSGPTPSTAPNMASRVTQFEISASFFTSRSRSPIWSLCSSSNCCRSRRASLLSWPSRSSFATSFRCRATCLSPSATWRRACSRWSCIMALSMTPMLSHLTHQTYEDFWPGQPIEPRRAETECRLRHCRLLRAGPGPSRCRPQ